MTATLTLTALLAMSPCLPSDRIAMFAGRDKLTIRQAFKSGATVRDICWLMGRLDRRADIVTFANFCAAQAKGYAADAANAADDAADAADDAANWADDADDADLADYADCIKAQQNELIRLLSK